jgi:hypothetical protein
MVVTVNRRLHILHVDDDAKVLGKAHFRIEALETPKHFEAAGRNVIRLGRREVEIGLAQPGFRQDGQPRWAVDQDDIEHAAHMAEQRADAVAQAAMQAFFGHFAFEQGKLHVAGDEVDGARLVHIGDAAHHEARPVHRHVVEHARHQQVDDGQAIGLQAVQIGGREQHCADAGLRIGIDD